MATLRRKEEEGAMAAPVHDLQRRRAWDRASIYPDEAAGTIAARQTHGEDSTRKPWAFQAGGAERQARPGSFPGAVEWAPLTVARKRAQFSGVARRAAQQER